MNLYKRWHRGTYGAELFECISPDDEDLGDGRRVMGVQGEEKSVAGSSADLLFTAEHRSWQA